MKNFLDFFLRVSLMTFVESQEEEKLQEIDIFVATPVAKNYIFRR